MTADVDAPAGLQLLDELRQILLDTARREVGAAWTTFQTADNLEVLAVAWRSHREDVLRRLNVIRLLPSCSQRTGQLQRTLSVMEQETRRREAQAQISALEATLTQVSDLTSTLEVPASRRRRRHCIHPSCQCSHVLGRENLRHTQR